MKTTDVCIAENMEKQATQAEEAMQRELVSLRRGADAVQEKISEIGGQEYRVAVSQRKTLEGLLEGAEESLPNGRLQRTQRSTPKTGCPRKRRCSPSTRRVFARQKKKARLPSSGCRTCSSSRKKDDAEEARLAGILAGLATQIDAAENTCEKLAASIHEKTRGAEAEAVRKSAAEHRENIAILEAGGIETESAVAAVAGQCPDAVEAEIEAMQARQESMEPNLSAIEEHKKRTEEAAKLASEYADTEQRKRQGQACPRGTQAPATRRVQCRVCCYQQAAEGNLLTETGNAELEFVDSLDPFSRA
eukprot:Polyplicarium_translucidae@DN3308_c2_g1_i16.p2